MNPIISLFMLTVALDMQTEAANIFEGITRLKNTVNSVSNDLTRYNNNLEYNVKTKLNNLKFGQMTNVNNAVNPALADIQSAIAAAKNEGRNADHCYEPLRQSLADASKTAFGELEKCVNVQVDTLKPLKQNIQSHLLNGKLLLSNLDSIAISCSSGTPMQAQLCVAQKMPAASSSVKNFEATAQQLKSTGDSLSSAAQIGATNCFQAPMSNLYGAVGSARITATTCVKDAK